MDPLATVGELENHLQRELDPDVAAQALQLASGAVRAFCKWDLSFTANDTLHADGNNTVVLTLPTLRLVAVSAVRVNGVAIDLDPTLVSFSRKGQLYRPYGWPRYAVVEVDCDHGYEPIPDLVKLACLDVAATQLNNPRTLVSASVGSVSQTYNTGEAKLTPLHERLLERYSI
jgi:hypothetical protein